MRRAGLAVVTLIATLAWASGAQKSPGAGPTIVLETARGTIEIETYPDEAPKTVAQIVRLVKDGFYDGLRVHRAEPGFLVQVGDPDSRDLSKKALWGRGASGTPIGVAEITKKRRNVRGAVAMGYPGTDPRRADSQFYILLDAHPELDEKYTVFGAVLSGMDVVDALQREDLLRKASVKE